MIIRTFDEIDERWLFTGEGDMLKNEVSFKSNPFKWCSLIFQT